MVSATAFAGPMHDGPAAQIVVVTPPPAATVEAPVDRFGSVRASVNDFAHVDGSSQMTRRSLSDEERQEMRRQIDEAIRKAYPRRRAQD